MTYFLIPKAITIRSEQNHNPTVSVEECLMSGLHNDLLNSKQSIWITPPSTSSLSWRLRLVPLHTCPCPWWWSHGPGISNILGSSIQLRLYLYQWPLWASHSAISFSPWHLLSWGLYCNWGCANNGLSWPLTEPTLSWTSSILQLSCCPKQYNLRDFYTPRSVSSLRYSTDPLWITASVSQP